MFMHTFQCGQYMGMLRPKFVDYLCQGKDCCSQVVAEAAILIPQKQWRPALCLQRLWWMQHMAMRQHQDLEAKEE